MAGMLPGVECARRRRIQSGPRPSSLCLYISNHEHKHTSTSSLQTSIHKDEELEGAAREAKERLDERLRAHRKSQNKRGNTKDCSSFVEGGSRVLGELQTEALGSKKSGSERFRWVKLSWKSPDQDKIVIFM
ncbi:hypothetical protein CJ030_MR1G014943 [Morella rubra]|uniref:Uncharacterized protein n=1 Tax=Morella rubra TaxID=262757 RepID=A0A6A1WNY1_9ROSI|nr:hypothetical protein CJ030_MR1G014943 [Morella rubra]